MTNPDDGTLAAKLPEIGFAAINLVVLHESEGLVKDDKLGLVDDRPAEKDERLISRRLGGKRFGLPCLRRPVWPKGGEQLVNPGDLLRSKVPSGKDALEARPDSLGDGKDRPGERLEDLGRRVAD